jgi:hypothetical protein
MKTVISLKVPEKTRTKGSWILKIFKRPETEVLSFWIFLKNCNQTFFDTSFIKKTKTKVCFLSFEKTGTNGY